jgi:hypothetical protein
LNGYGTSKGADADILCGDERLPVGLHRDIAFGDARRVRQSV